MQVCYVGILHDAKAWDNYLPNPKQPCQLETLGSHSKEGLDFKPSPPLSKVSIIPHDLFYFQHCEVPLAAGPAVNTLFSVPGRWGHEG